MATRILPNIRREPTIQMKNRFLFDIYRREGEQFFFENKYKEAIDSYNAALEIDPGSKVALMARSRCYFEMGLVQRSLVDCEAVLAMENTYPDAVYQKAEIYYALENYEMALLFYHRGHKLGYRGFQEGIDRCKERVKHNESGRTMKLTPAGDLTIYVHKKMRKLSSTPREENKQKFGRSGKTRSLFRDPSVVSYKLNLSPNPLVRLDKKERARARSYKLANRQAPSHRAAANQRSYSDRPVNYRNETSNETRDKDEVIHSDRSGVKEGQGYYSPDEKTMRIILGKLYGDKEYLENFVQKIDNQTHFKTGVRSLAEDGLGFLYERILYWSGRSLQPSPPPSPPLSQKYIHQSGRDPREKSASPLSPPPRLRSSLWQREVSEFIRNLESPEGSEADDVTEDGQDKMVAGDQTRINPESINFVFRSVRPDSQDARARERVSGGGARSMRVSVGGSAKSGLMPQIGEEGEVDEDSILVYLNRELKDIQEAFDKEEHEECIRRSTVCLQTVEKYGDEEISDKRDLVARIHSYLGNSLLEEREYDEAIRHHEKDLEIGEDCKLDEPISRALGNLGRAYFLKKQYNKALGAFARKTKLATQPVELAWLFHEIGNCFLCLNQFQHTCACANKSLDAAFEADNTLYQLQSCVLLAVAQVKLEQYEVAHATFERALDLARLQGDTQSEELIKAALGDVNENISRELREKLNVRGPSQCRSHHHQDADVDADGDGDEQRGRVDNVAKPDAVLASDSDGSRSGSRTDERRLTSSEDAEETYLGDKDSDKENYGRKSQEINCDDTTTIGTKNENKADVDSKDREADVDTSNQEANIDIKNHEANCTDRKNQEANYTDLKNQEANIGKKNENTENIDIQNQDTNSEIKSQTESEDSQTENDRSNSTGNSKSWSKSRVSSTSGDVVLAQNNGVRNATERSHSRDTTANSHRTGKTGIRSGGSKTSEGLQPRHGSTSSSRDQQHRHQNGERTGTTGSVNHCQRGEDKDANAVKGKQSMTSYVSRKTTPPIDIVPVRESDKDKISKEQFESEV